MSRISPRLLLELSQVADEALWIPVAYAGLDDEVDGKPREPLWDIESVGNFEALDTKGRRRAVKGGGQQPPTPSPEKPRERRRTKNRQRRLEKRRVCPGQRYIRRHSIDPLLDCRLSSGAVRTLGYIICRCGKGKAFAACTNWVAEDLGLTTRAVQYHYAALEAAGYILRLGPDSRGQTTITLRPSVEPPPYRPRKPDPELTSDERPESVFKSQGSFAKLDATSTISQMTPAKKSSPTQAMKARIPASNAELDPEIENLNLDPREPGSEPARPARPPSPALGGASEAQPLRFSQESQLNRDPRTAAGGQQAEPTAFDLNLDAILARVVGSSRVPERGWGPGGALRGQDPDDEAA